MRQAGWLLGTRKGVCTVGVRWEKRMIHILDGTARESARFHHATQENVRFKTYKLFIRETAFPFNIFRPGLTVVTETVNKGGVLYTRYLHMCLHALFQRRRTRAFADSSTDSREGPPPTHSGQVSLLQRCRQKPWLLSRAEHGRAGRDCRSILTRGVKDNELSEKNRHRLTRF